MRSPFVGLMRIRDQVSRPVPERVWEADERSRTPHPKHRTKAPWRGPERRVIVPPAVLLVDDQPDQLDIYRQYLHFEGYRVAVASGGRVALDVALAARPDVIIMDLAMPGMDGFEATRRIKELKATRDIPVIALSAYGEIPPEWALAAGCETYLRKPILPQDLSEHIERALVRASRR
ncbi:MAG TPA: response regulator [Vicinamibacteria bacterium]|nr:response regulator [Vicinamibacteria bacterium]